MKFCCFFEKHHELLICSIIEGNTIKFILCVESLVVKMLISRVELFGFKPMPSLTGYVTLSWSILTFWVSAALLNGVSVRPRAESYVKQWSISHSYLSVVSFLQRILTNVLQVACKTPTWERTPFFVLFLLKFALIFYLMATAEGGE